MWLGSRMARRRSRSATGSSVATLRVVDVEARRWIRLAREEMGLPTEVYEDYKAYLAVKVRDGLVPQVVPAKLGRKVQRLLTEADMPFGSEEEIGTFLSLMSHEFWCGLPVDVARERFALARRGQEGGDLLVEEYLTSLANALGAPTKGLAIAG